MKQIKIQERKMIHTQNCTDKHNWKIVSVVSILFLFTILVCFNSFASPTTALNCTFTQANGQISGTNCNSGQTWVGSTTWQVSSNVANSTTTVGQINISFTPQTNLTNPTNISFDTTTFEGASGGAVRISFQNSSTASELFGIQYNLGGSDDIQALNGTAGGYINTGINPTNFQQRKFEFILNLSARTYQIKINNIFVGLNYSMGGTSTGFDNIRLWNTASSTMWQIVDNITIIYDPSVISSNITLSAKDFYTSAGLTNFSAIIDNYQYNTTTGTITLPYLTNATRLFNITYLSTQNGGYFNNSYLDLNLSSGSHQGSIYQSIISFVALEKYTNITLSGFTFNTSYLTNATHYMAAGSYNVSAVKSGYRTETQQITVTPFEVSTRYFSVSNTSLNISFVQQATGTVLSGWSLRLQNYYYNVDETYNVSGTNFILNLTTGINYTLTLNKANYTENISYYTPTLSAHNYTVYTAKYNQLFVTFRDEETLSAITGVTWSLISASNSLNGTTSTVLNLDNLTENEYELRYSATNYTPRSYFVNIPIIDPSAANLTVYSLKNTSAFQFTLYVTDNYELPQPNLKVSLLRRYAINNQTVYFVVEQMKPSYALSGQTVFQAVANTVPYIFRVEDANNNVVFQGNGLTTNNLETLYLISNPIYIRVGLTTNPFTNAQKLSGLSYQLTNSSSTFWFSISDPDNYASQMCLKVVANTTLVVYDFCSLSKEVILSYATVNNNANNTIYTAYGYVYDTNGVINILDTKYIDYRQKNGARLYGNFGLFMGLIAVIVICVAFADKPMFMVIGVALSLVALGSTALDIVWLSPTMSGSLIVMSIIIAYIMRDY